MPISLSRLARMVNGQLVGDGRKTVSAAATLHDAADGQITFADSPQMIQQLQFSCATAVLVPRGLEPPAIDCIQVEDVRQAFTRVVEHFRPPRSRSQLGIHPAAHISSTARLADHVDIYPGAYVGDDVVIESSCVIHSGAKILAGCRLAEHVVVFPGVVLYEDTVIGPRSIIHANAVVGGYGFGYETVQGRHQRCAQLGGVEIGADVEIGAGSTIDRGTFGPTRIGDGTKIDNQVMIGHNCQIGCHNLLCSQVGIAGSVTTGDYVVMAGQVGIRDHVKIADQVVLGARSGVGADIVEGGNYFGAPARPDRQQLQILLAQQRVPAMRRQIKELEKKVQELSRELPSRRSEAA